MGDRVVARVLAGKPTRVLGDPDVPHTVTYIEDFARALVTLGEREEAPGDVWHVPNDETVTTRRFVELVFAEFDRPPRLRGAPRWGPCSGRPVQPDAPSRAGAALLVGAPVGSRQRQVRADARVARLPASGRDSSDGVLVQGPGRGRSELNGQRASVHRGPRLGGDVMGVAPQGTDRSRVP